MKVFALVPVKLNNAKTRLSSKLSKEERAELVLCMLKDVLDALSAVDRVVIIGSNIKDKLENKVDFLYENGNGLNNAVRLGTQYSINEGADATLFVPADTPLLTKAHVEEILTLGRKYSAIISPSRRGGTGILFRRPPDIIKNRFTKSSFAEHKKEAVEKKVGMFIYDSFALSLDIDAPEDAKEFLLHGKGTRTYDFLKKIESRFV